MMEYGLFAQRSRQLVVRMQQLLHNPVRLIAGYLGLVLVRDGGLYLLLVPMTVTAKVSRKTMWNWINGRGSVFVEVISSQPSS